MTLLDPVPLPLHDIYTVADLDLFPESSLIEVIDGALIVNPPSTFRHGHTQLQVAMWLDAIQTALGRTVLTKPGLRVGGSGVIPDVVLSGVPADDTVWLDPSDVLVVVEVLSPSTRDRDLGRKRELYHDAGITYVIVNPAEQSITVHDDPHDLDVDALAARLGWSGLTRPIAQ